MSQSDRRTLTGTVSDPQNAVIPNCEVKARNAATGAYPTLTTATGLRMSGAPRSCHSELDVEAAPIGLSAAGGRVLIWFFGLWGETSRCARSLLWEITCAGCDTG